ncbi:MAG: four helix bundle protein [Patescibacteria group bacterium]|nr:four helix bundle protein [Patescibacteria group bacterium]MDD5715213.1 four helix bundle protein [Patescibacteria group bacterium]
MNNSQLSNKKFDLEERTATFGRSVIGLAKRISETPVTRPLITQVIRAATSVGANYCEADNAESRKDFKHKISICRKESKESRHWLIMLDEAVPSLKTAVDPLKREATELTLIFNAIVNSTNKRSY